MQLEDRAGAPGGVHIACPFLPDGKYQVGGQEIVSPNDGGQEMVSPIKSNSGAGRPDFPRRQDGQGRPSLTLLSGKQQELQREEEICQEIPPRPKLTTSKPNQTTTGPKPTTLIRNKTGQKEKIVDGKEEEKEQEENHREEKDNRDGELKMRKEDDDERREAKIREKTGENI